MYLNIINPVFKINDEDNNIFTIRKQDYSHLLPAIQQIVEPVREIGFDIVEVAIKNSRISSGELSKTIKQNLVIKIRKGTSPIDLTIALPKLVDDNYIIINGRKKIPLFQLFDIPLVTRGDTIKLRTNVATLMVSKEKSSPHISVTFLGKKLYFASLLFAYYGLDEVVSRFDLQNFKLVDETNWLELLTQDLCLYYKESKGYTQDDFINEIGRNYSKYDAKSKGEDVLYALDLIPKVDIETTKFLSTGSVIEELLLALNNCDIDDTLFQNKRVRCFEYMILSKISKFIFELCYTNRTKRQPKYNRPSTQILSECNVSDIVQFDFSINPVEELTKLSRISLLGPGGFKRENIPRHLRDICPSMFGRVCPVDTPDRDNCGVLQNLIPNVKLDENLRFADEHLEKQPISIPVSMVPFCEHDDQTRLQMASSQMRQAIMLMNFDKPMIRSGCEHLYTKHTQFMKQAKKDGEVIFVSEDFIIVRYNDGTPDIFNIKFRKIYVEHMDFMNTYVKAGDKFKAGDILAESNFCDDGIITLGKNLLTGVMVYHGYNYEDGIVISDRLVKENSLTSVHFTDLSFIIPPNKVLLSLDSDEYKPLPNVYDRISKGSSYAKLKSLSEEDPYTVFSEELCYEAENDFIISEVNIYANEWNEDIPQYKNWVESQIEKQKQSETDLKKILLEVMSNDEATMFMKENTLDLSSFAGKYKMKKEEINGVYVNITGVYRRPIKVGDKLANRHGNKGVVSAIVPEEKMPQLADGRHLDICINPLGIISRMNIGQIYELHLTMSLYDLKQHLNKMLVDGEDNDKMVEYLTNYISVIDKTENQWYLKQFIDNLPEKITKDFIDDLTLIQAPFESCKKEDVKAALDYTNTNFKQKLFNPISNCHIMNEIAVGYLYFVRMVHIAEEKLAARGIGSYAKRTLQPLGGRKNKGGQRVGEMETACIIGHDAPHNLFECLTTKSDCIDLKNQYIKDHIEIKPDSKKSSDTKPESVKLLNSYMTVIGVDQ